MSKKVTIVALVTHTNKPELLRSGIPTRSSYVPCEEISGTSKAFFCSYRCAFPTLQLLHTVEKNASGMV